MKKIIPQTTLSMIFLSVMFFSCSTAPTRSFEAPAMSGSSPDSGTERMIIHEVSLDLTVEDTEHTRNMLIEAVRHKNGFIVSSTGTLIAARIPSENLEEYIIFSRALGNVVSERRTGTDITDQYNDNVIRLSTLIDFRSRYLVLLERANTIAEILAIERELARVTTEIELLQGRIRQAESSVAYSSITVRFRERHETVRPGPVGWVFVGLYRGIRWLFVW